MIVRLQRLGYLVVCLTLSIHASAQSADAYDPLAVPDGFKAPVVDLVVSDRQRQRDIPLRVYLPASTSAAPVVLFSHGLGGSNQGNAFMGEHWAARGYVAVFLQHPGSDTSVWQGKPLGQRMASMRKAASAENFMLRVKDVPAVLDQLELWNAAQDHVLSGRLDMNRVGMSGHSFGAVTTQAVSGQSFMRRQAFTDPRIKAAIAFSPSSPRRGGAERAFDSVAIPWMLMTGTEDVAIIGDADLASRLAVYPALPAGNKYEVVLHLAEHSAFTDRALPGDKQQRNPNHHRAILALSTAFWDSYLRGEENAKAWLDGDGPRTVLEDSDRWQKK